MKNLTDIEKWKLLVKSDLDQAASEFGAQPSDNALLFAEELGVAYMAFETCPSRSYNPTRLRQI